MGSGLGVGRGLTSACVSPHQTSSDRRCGAACFSLVRLLSLLLGPRSKVVRKSIARVHTVYRANIRAALRNKITADGDNRKGRVSPLSLVGP